MSLYKREGSETFWVDIRHAGHRVRRSTGETNRAAAQRRHDEIKVELWNTIPITNERTWGDAADLWLDAETRSDSELLSLAKFQSFYSDRPLSAVTAESIETALSFAKTAGTYMRYRAMLMAILNKAKGKGWIDTLPLVSTRRDKKKKPRMWITEAEWTKLHAELPAHMKPMAQFALETGLRQANVLNLTWDRVSVDRRLLWVEAEGMKANTALSIPLSQGALDVLAAQKDKHPTFVFAYRGRAIKEVKTSFIAACIRAGIGRYVAAPGVGANSCALVYEGFTWHGLRHTWATWHMQNGTPGEVLQKLGGWSDARMVSNYSHHSPGHLASFADNNRRKT